MDRFGHGFRHHPADPGPTELNGGGNKHKKNQTTAERREGPQPQQRSWNDAENIVRKRERLRRELAQLDLEEVICADDQQWSAGVGRKAEEEWSQMDPSPWVEEESASNGRLLILDETGSLCEQCRAEEEAMGKRKPKRAAQLSRELSEQMNAMNRAEMERQKASQEAIRKEEMALRDAHERQRRIQQVEEEKLKAEEKKKSNLRAQREIYNSAENGRRKLAAGGKPKLSSKSSNGAIYVRQGQAVAARKYDEELAAKDDRASVQRMEEQLRRNDALKRSVERLEQFKQRQREEQEEVAKIKARGRSVMAAERIGFNERSSASLDRIGHRRGVGDHSVDPIVFEAWRKAHEENEQRYLVLQDPYSAINGGQVRRSAEEAENLKLIIERKRCRRCNKPIHERSWKGQ